MFSHFGLACLKTVVFRNPCSIRQFLYLIVRYCPVAEVLQAVGLAFSGRARFRSGFGLKFVKMFRADFGPAYTSFLYHSKKRFFSFLKYNCSAHCGDFCKWSDCDFSSDNSICKHTCVLSFSGGMSVTLFFRRRQPWGNYHGMALRWKDQSLMWFFACVRKDGPKSGFSCL